jgi:hypothetical protein
MPNATVRANARALPEVTTRRAALGAIIAAGAIGVAPIAAGAATAAEPVSAPGGLDAALFALIDEAREAVARVEAASGAMEEAQARTEEVPWPQALIVTEDDTRLWKLKAGDRFDVAHLSRMRENQLDRQRSKDLMSRISTATLDMLASGRGPIDDKDRAAVEKMKATAAREDQLIASLVSHRVDSPRRGAFIARARPEQAPCLPPCSGSRKGREPAATRSLDFAGCWGNREAELAAEQAAVRAVSQT